MVYELVYTSAAQGRVDVGVLGAILEVSRRNNARLDVSGILLFHEGSFLQVLEGEREVVEELYTRIAEDPRHSRCRRLREGPVGERSFAGWSMGFVSLDVALVTKLVGRHALSSNGTLRADDASVLSLLDAFRAGQHRRFILA